MFVVQINKLYFEYASVFKINFIKIAFCAFLNTIHAQLLCFPYGV